MEGFSAVTFNSSRTTGGWIWQAKLLLAGFVRLCLTTQIHGPRSLEEIAAGLFRWLYKMPSCTWKHKHSPPPWMKKNVMLKSSILYCNDRTDDAANQHETSSEIKSRRTECIPGQNGLEGIRNGNLNEPHEIFKKNGTSTNIQTDVSNMTPPSKRIESPHTVQMATLSRNHASVSNSSSASPFSERQKRLHYFKTFNKSQSSDSSFELAESIDNETTSDVNCLYCYLDVEKPVKFVRTTVHILRFSFFNRRNLFAVFI